MTIDDELLLEIFKPDCYGNLGKDALIIQLIGSGDIKFTLEESHSRRIAKTGEVIKMTPDNVRAMESADMKYSQVKLK